MGYGIARAIVCDIIKILNDPMNLPFFSDINIGPKKLLSKFESLTPYCWFYINFRNLQFSIDFIAHGKFCHALFWPLKLIVHFEIKVVG